MKLSIITVNLNNADGLARTLESVREQFFASRECIVMDGESFDGSLEVIAGHQEWLHEWHSEPDGGIYEAMNKGLQRARGEYVFFLNSGDAFAAPDVLSRIFERNEFTEDLLYGNSLRPDGLGGWREHQQPESLSVARFFGMGLCHQTIFYKKKLFDELGRYNEDMQIVADWDFNVRALLRGCSTRHLSFPVVCYQGGGISETRVEEAEKEKDSLLRRNLPAATYPDYERLRFLEHECSRLKQYEDWVRQIQRRNPFLNYAMVTKWALLKLKLWPKRQEGGSE